MEIKKSDWTKFIKKFNASNQYRSATISTKDNQGNFNILKENSLFTGILLEKQGRQFTSAELCCSKYDAKELFEAVTSIDNPLKLTLRKEESGLDESLALFNKDQNIVLIKFTSSNKAELYHQYVEKIAYAIGENRGFEPGGEIGDWLDAENKIENLNINM